MKYYATIKSNHTVGCWEEIKAKTRTGAKIISSKKLGNGHHGDEILLIKVSDN